MPKTSEENNLLNDDSNVFEDIGVLFDENHQGTTKQYHFSDDDNNGSNEDQRTVVQVSINSIDEDPGSLQSGNYLWPGARILSEYLVKNPSCLPSKPKSILELGAGAAMVSLVALQLYQSSLQCMYITDRDRGTLERARDNYETLEDLYERAGRESEEQQFKVINEIGSIPVEFQPLKWGDKDDIKRMKQAALDHIDPPIFDVMLMADVIYSTDVVPALFATVDSLLNHRNGVILLSQSFAFDKATEDEIISCCEKSGLRQTVLMDEGSAGERIRKFVLADGDYDQVGH
jgi:predicted nicotinamide N-methyase